MVKAGRTLASSYKNRKAVIQNIRAKDVDDVEGGFAWAALLPILGQLGLPLAQRGVAWLGDKIFGKGLLRAGDRRGMGIFQAGSSSRGMGYEPGDINLKVPQHIRKQFTYKPGDMPTPTKYVIHGGVDIAKLKQKLIPFLKANDPEGFKRKLMKTVGKNQ